MKHNQRDVVYVKAPTPNGNIERHPFLIISCRSANAKENYYTGVMMTSHSATDLFSFKVTSDMFERPISMHNCQFRLHIIVSFPESKTEGINNVMNKTDFRELIKQITEFVICVD